MGCACMWCVWACGKWRCTGCRPLVSTVPLSALSLSLRYAWCVWVYVGVCGCVSVWGCMRMCGLLASSADPIAMGVKLFYAVRVVCVGVWMCWCMGVYALPSSIAYTAAK